MYLTNVRLQKENREKLPSLGNSCCTHAMLDVLLPTVLQNIVHLIGALCSRYLACRVSRVLS